MFKILERNKIGVSIQYCNSKGLRSTIRIFFAANEKKNYPNTGRKQLKIRFIWALGIVPFKYRYSFEKKNGKKLRRDCNWNEWEHYLSLDSFSKFRSIKCTDFFCAKQHEADFYLTATSCISALYENQWNWEVKISPNFVKRIIYYYWTILCSFIYGIFI